MLRRRNFLHVINTRFFASRKMKLFKQIADLQIVFFGQESWLSFRRVLRAVAWIFPEIGYCQV
jgi:hypothetical protein